MGKLLKAYRSAMSQLGDAYDKGTASDIDRLETECADLYARIHD